MKKYNKNISIFKELNVYIHNKVDIESYLKLQQTVDILKEVMFNAEQSSVFDLINKENYFKKISHIKTKENAEYEVNLRNNIIKYFRERLNCLTEIDIKLLNYIDEELMKQL